MHKRVPTSVAISLLIVTMASGVAIAADNPYLGGWELTIPGGAAGWLGVRDAGDHLEASLLWGGGSVLPLASAKVENDQLVLTRQHPVTRKDADGKTVKTNITEIINATVEGDVMKLRSTKVRENGDGEEKTVFAGKRTPPMPPAPDLRKTKFGKRNHLFNSKDLAGWRLTDPHALNGWSARHKILANEAMQAEGQPRKHYGNLRTDQEFEDFNLKLEARVPDKGNSGVYLRGIYEVQVCDSYGKPLDPHNMGAIYSRIKPTVSAEKAAGKWQKLDITLVERHVTVVLNGKRIVDNQPVEGCTGGALWSDVSWPGPIYLQGDHTGIEYRNIVLRPVVK